jgi:hypothetical protein
MNNDLNSINILFIADFFFFKNINNKAYYNFINYIANNTYHNVKIIYTDHNRDDAENEIVSFNPNIIIFFEINAFQHHTKNFGFVFELNIPTYIFLDDSYYISSITSKCEYVNLCRGIIFWYKSKKIINSYKKKYPTKHILNLDSRYVNTDVYKDWGYQKDIDILVYGNIYSVYDYKNEEIESIQDYIKKYEINTNTIIDNKIDFYPLRRKLVDIFQKYSNKFTIVMLDSSSTHNSTIVNEELSKLINRSYLTLACSSIADVLLHKYLEISSSRSLILGNYPSEYKELFDGNIIEVNEFMNEEEIIEIIDNALNDKIKLKQMSDMLYEKIRLDHNLEKAVDNFNNIIIDIIEKNL